jgi:hypothetical protein
VTALVTAAACLGCGGLGYLIGRFHERQIHFDAMGYIRPPAATVEHWTGEFPAPPAVALYDQEAAIVLAEPLTKNLTAAEAHELRSSLAATYANLRKPGAAA